MRHRALMTKHVTNVTTHFNQYLIAFFFWQKKIAKNTLRSSKVNIR